MLTPKELAERAAKAKAEKAAAEQGQANQADSAANAFIAAEYAKAVAKIPEILEKAAGDGKDQAVVYQWEVAGYSAHSKELAVVGDKVKAHLEEQGFTVQVREFEKLAVAVERMHQWSELIVSW